MAVERQNSATKSSNSHRTKLPCARSVCYPFRGIDLALPSGTYTSTRTGRAIHTSDTPREAQRFKLALYLHALRFRWQSQPFLLKNLLHRASELQETFPVRACILHNIIKGLSVHKGFKTCC
jgi:hypothetical protein